jgi:hypothetical protein
VARARDEFPNLEEAKPQKIPPPAGESRALPKYFEHAGALLTADGTDDDKIKLESAPVGFYYLNGF